MKLMEHKNSNAKLTYIIKLVVQNVQSSRNNCIDTFKTQMQEMSREINGAQKFNYKSKD